MTCPAKIFPISVRLDGLSRSRLTMNFDDSGLALVATLDLRAAGFEADRKACRQSADDDGCWIYASGFDAVRDARAFFEG